jgi:hypothetical protein
MARQCRQKWGIVLHNALETQLLRQPFGREKVLLASLPGVTFAT